MTIQLKASERLQQVSVEAATDTKGAIKYIRSVLTKYLEVNSVKVVGDKGNEIAVTCKGPVGKVEFSLYLANKKQLYIDFFNTEGLEPQTPDIDNSISDFKMSKRVSIDKALKSYTKGLARASKEADAFAAEVQRVREWTLDLTEALTELKSNMD